MSGDIRLDIIPTPRSLTLLGGWRRLPLRGWITDATGLGECHQGMRLLLGQLREQITACSGFDWYASCRGAVDGLGRSGSPGGVAGLGAAAGQTAAKRTAAAGVGVTPDGGPAGGWGGSDASLREHLSAGNGCGQPDWDRLLNLVRGDSLSTAGKWSPTGLPSFGRPAAEPGGGYWPAADRSQGRPDRGAAPEAASQGGLLGDILVGGDQSDILLSLDPALPAQGYRLQVPSLAGGSGAGQQVKTPITVVGADWEGLRNGVQTLRQLLMAHGLALPCVRVVDEPALRVRALSYDISRGRVPAFSTLIALADLLCLYKYNQLQLYVEHAVALEGIEQAWAESNPLAPEEIKTFDDYCQQRGIELVPQLATFGHMYSILRTPQYRDLGEHPEQADREFSFVERMQHHTIDVTNPRSRQLVTSLVDQYSALYASKQFNICADETFDLGTGQSQLRAAGRSPAQLYVEYVGSLCQHLSSQGRQPIMYADIALHFPQLLGQLPAETIFAHWDYGVEPSAVDISLVASSGHTWYVCPGLQTWNRLLPDLHAAWLNIFRMCAQGQRSGAAGMVVTEWGDYGHVNDPALSVPGLLYAAECAWCQLRLGGEDSSYETELNERISRLQYRDDSGQLVGLLSQAGNSQNAVFSWADAVQFKELDESGLANDDVMRAAGLELGLSTAAAGPSVGTPWPAEAGAGIGSVGQSAGWGGRWSAQSARQQFLQARQGRLEQGRVVGNNLQEIANRLCSLMADCDERPGLAGAGLGSVPTLSAALLMLLGQLLLNDCGQWLDGWDEGAGLLSGAGRRVEALAGVVPGPDPADEYGRGRHSRQNPVAMAALAVGDAVGAAADSWSAAGWPGDDRPGRLAAGQEVSDVREGLRLMAARRGGEARPAEVGQPSGRTHGGSGSVGGIGLVETGVDKGRLRRALEEWTRLYTSCWHRTSRPSELNRLLEVFRWYAGLLQG